MENQGIYDAASFNGLLLAWDVTSEEAHHIISKARARGILEWGEPVLAFQKGLENMHVLLHMPRDCPKTEVERLSEKIAALMND